MLSPLPLATALVTAAHSRFLGRARVRRTTRNNDVYSETNYFDGVAYSLVQLPACIAIFNRNIFTLDVAKRTKTLTKCLDTLRTAYR